MVRNKSNSSIDILTPSPNSKTRHSGNEIVKEEARKSLNFGENSFTTSPKKSDHKKNGEIFGIETNHFLKAEVFNGMKTTNLSSENTNGYHERMVNGSPSKNDQDLANISRLKQQPSLYRKMFGAFKSGHDVLARWSDGLYYLGSVKKVNDFEQQCYVQFEDRSTFWVNFKDLQDLNNKDGRPEDTDSDLTCSLCRDGLSEPPNEIVICDKCGQGYHQSCHMPPIDTSVLNDEDMPWQCRTCVFAAAARRGGAEHEGAVAVTLKLMKQVLPYDLSLLTWDKGHKSNTEETYCYCGGPGDWYLKMLQCCRCQQWFHEACLQCLETPVLYGDRFFIFVCSLCNQGEEFIKRLPMRWVDVTHLVMYNITIAKKVRYYDFMSAIMPFFAQHWDELQLGDLVLEASTRSQLKDRVIETLQNNKTRFQLGAESKKGRSSSWAIRTRSPPVPPLLGVPPDIKIDNALLDTLDLRHGSVFLNESPTPLKRNGPGDFPVLSPRKSKDSFEESKVAGDHEMNQRRGRGRPRGKFVKEKVRGGVGGKRKMEDDVFQDTPPFKSLDISFGSRGQQELKTSMANYFGAESRMASGERYRVLGKRTIGAKTEYLIQWEGFTPQGLRNSLKS